MTDESWAGWYRDTKGSDAVVLTTDGRQLRIRIRGVDFEGESFDDLGPVAGLPPESGMFALADGALTDCVLEWDLPLPVLVAGTLRHATLSCLLSLRRVDPDLHLALHLDGAVYESARAERDFNAALAAVQRILPDGVRIQTCVACAFSDYFPAPGRGLSGGLACFRGPRTPTGARRARTTCWICGTRGPDSSRRSGAAASSRCARPTARAPAIGEPSRWNSPDPTPGAPAPAEITRRQQDHPRPPRTASRCGADARPAVASASLFY